MFGTPNIYIYIWHPDAFWSRKKNETTHAGQLDKATWKKHLESITLTFLYNWPSSKICKFFTLDLRVIQLFKQKHQKKQQSLRSLRSLFAFGPKSTSVPTHVAIRATDRPGIFHRAVIDESPGRTWISVVFYRDPMSNRDDVTGIPAYLDPSFGCHLLQVPGPFWGVFWGCRP